MDKPPTPNGRFEETKDVQKSEVPTIEQELRCAGGKTLHQENQPKETIHWVDLKEGLFVLVRVLSYKKTAIEYKYVCIIQNKDEEDGEITVQGLRLSNEKVTQFVLIENDTFNVDLKSAIQILPEPSITLKK